MILRHAMDRKFSLAAIQAADGNTALSGGISAIQFILGILITAHIQKVDSTIGLNWSHPMIEAIILLFVFAFIGGFSWGRYGLYGDLDEE